MAHPGPRHDMEELERIQRANATRNLHTSIVNRHISDRLRIHFDLRDQAFADYNDVLDNQNDNFTEHSHLYNETFRHYGIQAPPRPYGGIRQINDRYAYDAPGGINLLRDVLTMGHELNVGFGEENVETLARVMGMNVIYGGMGGDRLRQQGGGSSWGGGGGGGMLEEESEEDDSVPRNLIIRGVGVDFTSEYEGGRNMDAIVRSIQNRIDDRDRNAQFDQFRRDEELHQRAIENLRRGGLGIRHGERDERQQGGGGGPLPPRAEIELTLTPEQIEKAIKEGKGPARGA